jgi:A/G-specific adenine glycosylase
MRERYLQIAWRHAGTVRHAFTHFRLDLDVMTAAAPKGFRAKGDQQWIAPENARLPSVMKKAVEKALASGRGVDDGIPD